MAACPPGSEVLYMITVLFNDGSDYAEAAGKLWQWDYGRVLRIQGLDLSTAAEIHFSLQSVGGEAITRIGIARDGVTDVVIPDSLLEGNQTQPYYIHVWVYQMDDTGGRTIKSARIWVNARPKPEAFDNPGDTELFREVITAVNEASARAEAAGGEAGAAKEAAESARTRSEAAASESQEAKAAAELSAGEAAGYKDQAANSATYAALSERAASESGKLAGDYAARAEASADVAHEDAGRTAQDRIQTGLDAERTAKDQEATAQDRKAVAADRAAVGQDKVDVDTAATRAITDIRDAKDVSITAISNEGTRQVSVVTEAGGAQVSAVSREGATQIQAVQEAAAGIMADREQIAANKTDIGALTDRVDVCAPGIIVEATGATQVTVGDAWEAPMANMEVLGRSEQFFTTGAQLLDLSSVNKSAGGAVVNYADGGYSISGTGALTDSFTASYTLDKNVLKPGNLILKSELTIPKLYIRIWDGNTVLAEMQGNSTKQITQEMIDNDNVRVECFLYGNTGSTITPGTYHPMLYQDGDGTWEPYTGGKPSPSPDYPQEIVSTDVTAVTVTGANLLNSNTLTREVVNAATGMAYPSTTYIASDYIPNIPGQQYRLSTINNQYLDQVVGYDIDKNAIINGGAHPTPDGLFKVSDNASYIRIRFYNNGEELSIPMLMEAEPMLNVGPTPLPYHPYQSEAATITLTEPLRGIGDYRDRIMCRDGVWGIKRKIGEWVGDGSPDENWGVIVETEAYIRAYVPYKKGIQAQAYANVLCNQLVDRIGTGGITVGNNTEPSYYIDKSRFPTLEDFMAHISTHPLVTLYVRDTPTWEPLPSATQSALNALTTYKGHTTVSVATGGPEPDITLEYVADTKTYIKNEHAKMQAEFDRQIAAILALLPAETQAAMINNETSALLAESEV